MTQRIETAQITVTAGTAIAAPAVTALSLRDAVLDRLEIRVPPGPSGLVGFMLLHSGQQVIPFASGTWIVTDDEKIGWDLTGYPTGDKWSVSAYNLDVYSHTLYFRLLLNELPLPAQPVQQPLSIVATGLSAH